MPAFPQESLSRLTLGTVQLGMPYGRFGPAQPPSEEAAHRLLDAAYDAGVTCFDTAPAYGDAERRLGAWLATLIPKGGRPAPLVISKLSKLPEDFDGDVRREARRRLTASLLALGRDSLDGYLVHHPADLSRPGLLDGLRDLEAEGLIGAFGVSVYDRDEADAALAMPGLSLIQAPISVLDMRFADAGCLDRCRERGVQVFARSVFLQGLLFQNPADLDGAFRVAAPAMARLSALAFDAAVPAASLALHGVLGLPGVASVVVGMSGVDDLTTNLSALAQIPDGEVLAAARVVGRGLPTTILDPRLWP